MRIIVAAALAASFAGAAWAAEPAKTTVVEKTTAVSQQVEAKEWSRTQCWVCYPRHFDKN